MKMPSNASQQRRLFILLIALLVLAELAVLLYFRFMLRSDQSTSQPTSEPGMQIQTGTATPQIQLTFTPEDQQVQSATATYLASLPTPDPWDGKGRVTILVMGLDYADWESDDRVGPPRSDTMILFTIDPASKTAGILSIPRDLWVTIPGFDDKHKINTAHRFGEFYHLPGGGPGLALRTVEKLLDVPINFYAVVDFYAFEKLINELGGIEVDVPEEIKVDPIGPHNTVVLQPGSQTLDGSVALAYARNRSTAGDETDRANRQQQVIMGIREKALSLENLPMLVLKSPALYNTLGQGIRTNLSLEQAVRLAWLVQEIPPDTIQRVAIGTHEYTNEMSADGQAIMVPILDRILALRDQIFTSSASGSSQGLTAEELVAAEYSRITIINQTGDESLGDLTADYLRSKGLNIIEVQHSNESRPKSRLVDHFGDPNTFRYLINLLHIPPSETYINIDMIARTDMEVFLGLDWAANNPLQK